LGDALLTELTAGGFLSTGQFRKFGVEDYPACGTPQEVLQHHGLDGASLAMRIRSDCNGAPARKDG
jgi:transketolase